MVLDAGLALVLAALVATLPPTSAGFGRPKKRTDVRVPNEGREFSFLGCFWHRKSPFSAAPLQVPMNFFVLEPTPQACFVWCWNFPMFTVGNESCECGWRLFDIQQTSCEAPPPECPDANGPAACATLKQFKVYRSARRNLPPATVNPVANPPFWTPATCSPPPKWDPNKLFLFTYITKFMSLTPFLLASALFNEIPIHVYGLYAAKSPISLPGYLRKVYCARDVVSALPPSTTVLFVDGADVVFNGPSTEIVSAFRRLTQGKHDPVLFGAEMNCYLVRCSTQLGNKSNTESPYKFLNSGVYIGSATAVKALLADFHQIRKAYPRAHKIHIKNPKELARYDRLAVHDQFWFGLLYTQRLKSNKPLVLDTNVELIQTTSSAAFLNVSTEICSRPAEQRSSNSRRQVCNCAKGTCPLIFHLPGRTRRHVMRGLLPRFWWYQKVLPLDASIWVGGRTVPFAKLDHGLAHLFRDGDALKYLRGAVPPLAQR